MIIRQKFRFEGAHIVRNCSSKRCRENIHGHSYEVEVFLRAEPRSSNFKVMDSMLFLSVKEFIHSFDHAFTLWDMESEEVKKAIYLINNRVAEIPVSPSAEGYALLFFYVIDHLISAVKLADNGDNMKLHAVRIHETQSGYAESSFDDLNLVKFSLKDIKFNEGIMEEWKDKMWWNPGSEIKS